MRTLPLVGGPVSFEGAVDVRDTTRQKRGDAHLDYLDGVQLFGVDPSDVEFLPDGLHPNGDGYELIGRRFAAHFS